MLKQLKKMRNSISTKTYDVVFNDDQQSNSKGFRYSLKEAKSYVKTYNGSNESYFQDYKGGTVAIKCNEDGIFVFETKIK